MAQFGVFSLYDYKRTSAFADHLPSPEEFWGQVEPVRFSVGANAWADAPAFLKWLKTQVPGLHVIDGIESAPQRERR